MYSFGQKLSETIALNSLQVLAEQCFKTGGKFQTDIASAKMPALPVLFISYSCHPPMDKKLSR